MTGNFVGKHVLLDVVVGDGNKKISNIGYIYQYLIDLTKYLDMTLIIPPIIVSFPFSNEANSIVDKIDKEKHLPSNVKEIINTFKMNYQRKLIHEAGISGITIWAESHASLHSWVESNYISLDVYSCKDFNHKACVNFIKDYFEVVSGTASVINRYTNTPHKIVNFEV